VISQSADPPLWNKQGAEKRQAVQEMFGEIAPTYDRVNSVMTFRMHYRWRRQAVRLLHLKGSERVLDLCCGTGDFIQAIHQEAPSVSTMGVDFSLPMLEIARAKLTSISLNLADACRLPLASGHFDAATVGWGLRNVPDLRVGLEEIVRVLKPGGQLVVVETGNPGRGLFGRASQSLFRLVVPQIGALFGHRRAYAYLPNSASQFMTVQEMEGAMRAAGFKETRAFSKCLGNVAILWGRT
jgi:demethylmenaquinone methyltransferase/2-methoxy-6-polyprenyl-1,4-benzoquinol methylase